MTLETHFLLPFSSLTAESAELSQPVEGQQGLKLLSAFLACMVLFFFQDLKKNLFIYFGCIGSSLLRVGFLQLWRAGATLRCSAQASHCSGFSFCGARALGRVGFSSCGSRALEHRLSSCGPRAYVLRSLWNLPGPGLEPVSPALAGGFLTTAPPGKSRHAWFFLGTLVCRPWPWKCILLTTVPESSYPLINFLLLKETRGFHSLQS